MTVCEVLTVENAREQKRTFKTMNNCDENNNI